MLEISIIKSMIKEKETYNKYYKHINNITTESHIKILFNMINKYYTKYPEHNYISLDELKTFFSFEYPNMKDKEIYDNLFLQLSDIDTSDSLAKDLIIKFIEKDFVNRIIQKGIPVISGEDSNVIESFEIILSEYKEAIDLQETDDEERIFVEDDLEELISQTTSDGLSWRLTCLNIDLGQLPGGSLGHFFARPDCGKTSFIHSEVSYFAGQLKDDEIIIWFNNEEAGSKVKLRLYSAICKATKIQIIQNTELAKKKFNEKGGNRIRLYDSATISVEDIERVCKNIQPRIVIIDVGDKLTYRGSNKAGNGSERLTGIYTSLREVVKRCNKDWKMDILTTGQSDAQSEGRQWLYQINLDGGKTGKAGAFDYIIGMGATDKEAVERYIYCCKNKMGDFSDKNIVVFDKQRARFSDI